MSLRVELETWAAALKAYEEEDFEKALDLFGRIADSSKILTNMGLIYATLGEHEAAVEQFNAATQLDQYLAVAYFQCGVSNFLLGRYELAFKDFEEALLYLRGNQAINYEQLGLKFRLYSAEVLFNKGLCLIYMGNAADGLQDMTEAQKEKATEEHNVIDEAIADGGEGYTVFSIPVGILYRPPENKMKNAKPKDYLGRAKLVAVDNPNDAYTTFTGATRLRQGFTPTGTVADKGPVDVPKPAKPAGAGVERAATSAARLERKGTTLQVGGASAANGGPKEGGGAGLQKAATIGSKPLSGPAGVLPVPGQGPQRGLSTRRPDGPPPATAPLAVEKPPALPGGKPSGPPGKQPSRLTEIYDDYLDGYGAGDEPPMPEDAKRVAAWASKTTPGPPAGGAGRTLSVRAPPSAYGGSNTSMRRRPTRRNTYRSRATSQYEPEEEGYESGEFDEVPFELVKIKIHYQGDVRGMAITPEIAFEEFLDRVAEKFGRKGADMAMKFQDEDGAKVSLRDESDFDLAIETARDNAKGKPEGKLVVWIEN